MSVMLTKSRQIVQTQGARGLLRQAGHRLAMAVSAWIALRKQPRFDDLNALVDFGDQSFDGLLFLLQVRSEILALLELVQERQPRTVVEIGTANGGTLFLWTRVIPSDAHLISIDLPGGKFGGGYASWRIPIYRAFAVGRQRIDLLRGNSHAASTFEKIKRLLNGQPIDFLFVDGDHTYEGVKRDWELYSPLVAPNGLVAFHDVAGNYEDTQVKRFWDTIKPSFSHREFLADPEKRYGIGVLLLSGLNSASPDASAN